MKIFIPIFIFLICSCRTNYESILQKYSDSTDCALKCYAKTTGNEQKYYYVESWRYNDSVKKYYNLAFPPKPVKIIAQKEKVCNCK
jgi:hypothetical protein